MCLWNCQLNIEVHPLAIGRIGYRAVKVRLQLLADERYNHRFRHIMVKRLFDGRESPLELELPTFKNTVCPQVHRSSIIYIIEIQLRQGKTVQATRSDFLVFNDEIFELRSFNKHRRKSKVFPVE